MATHADWWQGFDQETAHRIGLTLARVLGIWRWLKGPLLQQAWLTALVGWAAVKASEPQQRTADVDIALFTALCGRDILLAPDAIKARDLVSTWHDRLEQEGLEEVEPGKRPVRRCPLSQVQVLSPQRRRYRLRMPRLL